MSHPSDLIIRPIKDRNIYLVQFVTNQITDTYVIAKIHEKLMELAKKETGPKLALDFANISNISSEMLGKMLTVHKTAGESGGGLSIAGLDDPNIRSVFEITQLNKIFTVFPTIKDAEDKL